MGWFGRKQKTAPDIDQERRQRMREQFKVFQSQNRRASTEIQNNTTLGIQAKDLLKEIEQLTNRVANLEERLDTIAYYSEAE